MPCFPEFLVGLLFALHGGSVPPPDSALTTWVQQQRLAAEIGVQHEYVHASWRAEHVYVPPIAQLRAMQQAVANRPDHPDRDDLVRFERRLRQGPDTEHFDVWLGSRGSFRRNFVGANGQYEDISVQSRRSWAYSQTGHHLNLIDNKDSPPPGYNYRPWEYQLRGTLGGFAYGAFSIRFPGVNLELVELTTRDTRWRAILASREPRISLAIEKAHGMLGRGGVPLRSPLYLSASLLQMTSVASGLSTTGSQATFSRHR